MLKQINKPTRSPKRALIIGGSIGLAVLLVVGIVVGPPWWKRHRAQRDVEEIAFALRGFLGLYGHYPEGDAAAIAAALTGKNPAGQSPDKVPAIEASSQELSAKGEFVDPWGTPYRINVETDSPRVYSCGPNRTDEYGKGDDITSWK